jgi:hypothetical protein
MNRIHLALIAPLGLLLTPLACGEVETPEELGYAYELVDAGQCLERVLERDLDGRTRCRAVEVRPSRDVCDCDGRGRERLDEREQRRVRDAVERDPATRGRGLDCMCELRQLDGERLTACRTDERSPLEISGERIDGWCEVDRELARECNDLGRLRFEGDALLREEGRLFLGCLE